ncbi:MAG: PIN domain-containing protein [Actinomycetaceae bacterium]
MTEDGLVVVIDTDVWSEIYLPRRARKSQHADRWRRLLTGRTVVISTQTRAEVMFGFAVSGWGPDRKSSAREALDRTATAPVDEPVVKAWAELGAACRHQGHALHAKEHTGDRWVASTAIALGAPLLARDAVYQGAPGLILAEPAAGP